MKPTLTTEMELALVEFAAKYGRTWKQTLRDAWMSGNGLDAGLLRQVRNTMGPSWLIGYKLPKPGLGKDGQ
jgi:hypothetical protein